MADAAHDVPLANQLLLNPTLQYQLLLHSLLLPLLPPRAPGREEQEQEPLPVAVLANQMAITQLNHLVMDLVKEDSRCRAKGKQPMEPQREVLELLSYHKQLLQLLTKGFRAVQSDMTDANALLNTILNTTSAGHGPTEALKMQVMQETVSEGFANTTHDLANLSSNLQDLTSIQADLLGEYQETVQDAAIQMTSTFTNLIQANTKALEEMVSLVTEGFSGIQTELAELRREVHNPQNASAIDSQEEVGLAQLTAKGLLELQAKVDSLTKALGDASTTLLNLTSVVEGEDEINSSHVADASSCPSPFFPVGGECFHVSREEQRWSKARKSCRGVGGDLADPDDVLSLILAVRKHLGEDAGGVWVGGEERAEEKTPFVSRSDTDVEEEEPAPWLWLSGGEVAHGWLRGRPLGPPGIKGCLAIRGRGLDGDFCGRRLRYVCEYGSPLPPLEEEEEDDDEGYGYDVEEEYYK